MHVKTYFMFSALLLLIAKGNSDPLTYIASTPASFLPPASPEIGEKEVIVYLTPDQIENLKSGKASLEPVLESQTQPKDDLESVQIAENDYFNDEQLKRLLDQRKKYIETQSNVLAIRNHNRKSPAPVNEPNQEEFRDKSAQISWYPQENNKYYVPAAKLERNKYTTATSDKPVSSKNDALAPESPEESDDYIVSSEKPERLRHKNFNYYSVYNEKKGDNIDINIFHPASKDILGYVETRDEKTEKDSLFNKNYNLTPYDLIRKLSDTESPKDEENTRSQNYEQENSNEYGKNHDKENIVPKYAFRYNDQKQAIEILELIKKDSALAEVKRPSEVLKKLNIAPKPYIVRVSQPVETKRRKTYTLPLEIVRHVPVALEETEKIEAEKTVPYEVNRRGPSPGSKKFYVKVDKPYLVERIVPVEVRKEAPLQVAPKKLRILTPVWQH